MAQDNRSEPNLKLDIFVTDIKNPHEFQFYQATSKKSQPKKLNGSMIDISPADTVYDPTHLLNNVIALEWTKDSIEIFKNLVTARVLAFEIKNKKNDIFYGKLYVKLSHREKDVSEIMVEMGKAFNPNNSNQSLNAIDPSYNEYAKAVPDVQQTENEILEISVPVENAMSEVYSSSSSRTLVSMNTIERLEICASDASDDSEWGSKLMSVCSDDSGKTEEIGEAATFVPINHNPNHSNGSMALSDHIDAIPAYLLEDDISEIGAEKYCVPRNSDFFGKMEIINEANEMKELLKDAKRLDNTFKLLFAPMEKADRLMFHSRVHNYIRRMRDDRVGHIQERMWSIIAKGTSKNIHIVGDTHYIMYLPPICDSIYRHKYVPWKGPEALIVVSDTKEAKEIHEFCSIILKTNAVHLDLNTPSDKLSIKDAGIRKCAIVIVRLNRLANLMAMGAFDYCKYIVIDGVHRLWAHERHSLTEWLKRNRERFSDQVFERGSALLAIQSYMDGALIAGMQLTLHPSTKFNLFNDIGPCAIVSTNDESNIDLSDRLRKFLPKIAFNCISFFTDQEVQREKKGNFTVLVHNGLPKSFEIFEQRFSISVGILEQRFPINKGTNTFVKSIILMNNEEVTTKQKQILEMLRNRTILPDPCPKQSLVQNPRIRLKTKMMKIEVVSVLSPEQYKIRCESNAETIVRLADISPKLKFGWDSSDSFRVKCLLMSHPLSDQQIEAYIFTDGEQSLAEDMLIHESGKAINLKNWLREQEIIR